MQEYSPLLNRDKNSKDHDQRTEEVHKVNDQVPKIELNSLKLIKSGRYGIFILFIGLMFLIGYMWDTDNGSQSLDLNTPNIVFFLIDDLGFNDIGYSSSDIPDASPVMTKYAKKGVILSSYYTYSQCTPSRSSLMTGMYASSIGLQHDCIQPVSPFGMPLGITLLPEVLKEHGTYTTAMVGKWDLGHYASALWPSSRGFDSSLHLSCYGYTDYHKHTNMGNVGDLHNGYVNAEWSEDPDTLEMSDLLLNQEDPTYATFVFARRALKVIHEFVLSDSDGGLFLYVAWNAVHSTLSVPKGYNQSTEFTAITSNVDDTNRDRKLLAGALKQIDDCFSNIITTLNTYDMLENSVIVVASDNGGSVSEGGSNYPLRGWKKTSFEGGILVPAFIYSPLISSKVAGSVHSDLFHVSDWLPTLACGLQGLPVNSAYNGVDHWGKLATGSMQAKRESLVCDLDYLIYDGLSAKLAPNIQNITGCVIVEYSNCRFKFIWNSPDYGWALPDSSSKPTTTASLSKSRNGAFLFDLTNDPMEATNLFWDFLDTQTLDVVLAVFCDYYEKRAPSLWKDNDITALETFENNNMFITYWKDEVDESSNYAKSDGAARGPKCKTDYLYDIIYQD